MHLYSRPVSRPDLLSSLIQTVTVGSGISPDQPHMRVADSTAGREFHPAPKNISEISILLSGRFVNLFLDSKKAGDGNRTHVSSLEG